MASNDTTVYAHSASLRFSLSDLEDEIDRLLTEWEDSLPRHVVFNLRGTSYLLQHERKRPADV
jgi:hypothetical protein